MLGETYNFFIVKPLWNLYLDSPSIGSFGGWNGKTESDICTTITGVPSLHWDTTGGDECKNLIIRRFNSFISTAANVLYFTIIIVLVIDGVSMVRWSVRYTFYTRFLYGDAHYGTLQDKNSKI